MALIMQVKLDHYIGDKAPSYQRELFVQVSLVIVLTTVINAPSVGSLLSYIGITKKSEAERRSRNDAKRILRKEVEEKLESNLTIRRLKL